jgi:hypothetical protein
MAYNIHLNERGSGIHAGFEKGIYLFFAIKYK